MTLHSIFLLMFATFVFVMIPGPGVFAIISRSLQGGVMAGLTVITGLLSADLVYLSAALAGLSFIARDFQNFFFFVQLLGGGYLIWLGIRAWLSPAEPMTQVTSTQRSHSRDLIAGFLTSVSNPKAMLFYLGLLPNFVDIHRMTPARFASIAVIVALTLASGSLIYVLLCARMRRLFSSVRAVRWLHRSSAMILIMAGIYIATGTGDSPS